MAASKIVITTTAIFADFVMNDYAQDPNIKMKSRSIRLSKITDVEQYADDTIRIVFSDGSSMDVCSSGEPIAGHLEIERLNFNPYPSNIELFVPLRDALLK